MMVTYWLMFAAGAILVTAGLALADVEVQLAEQRLENGQGSGRQKQRICGHVAAAACGFGCGLLFVSLICWILF